MAKSVNIDTRLHFSRRDFHEKGWDKHLAGGFMLGIGGAGAALLFTSNPTGQTLAVAAAWTGAIGGLSVELFDYLDNKKNNPPRPHGVELMDALFTAAGGAVAAFLLYLLTK